MAFFNTRQPKVKQPKDIAFDWNDFRKGLNTLFSDSEIDPDELAEADNLILKGKGVPTKRWGTNLYFNSSATGSVRDLRGFYKSDGTRELLAITDEGYLRKLSGTSYASINGASWASGSLVDSTQLDDKIYIVSDSRELVRYSSPTLVGFPTISVPSDVFATQFSGASGLSTYSYRVSAVSNVGQTLASQAVQAGNSPQELVDGAVKVTWSGVSTASGVLQRYEIYGRNQGDERFLSSVGASTEEYLDDGSATPLEFGFPPTADSTGGVKAKFIERFEDRLVYAGVDGDPSIVIISGRVPFQERNDVASGGNYIRIEPDAGDEITGLAIFEKRIIVFKERSIWQVTLSSEQIGNFFVTIPTAQLITKSHGCLSNRSIVAVENDIFFLSRKGVYALGYEPNILSVLRTNEISAKIRDDIKNIAITARDSSTAFYTDFKYGITFPKTNKTFVYDRERLAWMGPWTLDANVHELYYDDTNEEILVYGEDDSPAVQQLDEDFGTDNGSSIETSLRTKQEDYGDWSLFKYIKNIFMQFRAISGNVNVDIRTQDRDGNIRTVKSFTISSNTVNNSGWGADQWGAALWGDSAESGTTVDTNETYRWSNLNKNARNIQFLVSTSGNSNYELLSVRSTAKPMGLGFLPSSERV
jgi:hypothetical protein